MRVREEDERDEEGALALAVEGAKGRVERREAVLVFSFLSFFREEFPESGFEPGAEGEGVFFGILLRDGVGDLEFFGGDFGRF